MFSSTSLATSSSSRRKATACSMGLHAAAVAALWAASQTITAPAIPRHEPREAVTIMSPPARLFPPRSRPKTAVQRFEVERADQKQIPEAIRAEPKAPKVGARIEPSPVPPSEPEIAVQRPGARPAGFAQVARAVAPKVEAAPQMDRFGAAVGRLDSTSVALPGGSSGFAAAGLARASSPVAAGGAGGFGAVEIGRAAQRTGSIGNAGFKTAERRVAVAMSSDPPAPVSRDQPVKILWKPVPKYSEEGLRRRVEGDVVLLVRFLAQGRVETLQVVSGLGYGLDEYAVQAAEAIRFQPATHDGLAVDSTAQVRIRFELAY